MIVTKMKNLYINNASLYKTLKGKKHITRTLAPRRTENKLKYIPIQLVIAQPLFVL